MLIVYAVMRSGQLIQLYTTEEDAEWRKDVVNGYFKRGKRATVVPLSVREGEAETSNVLSS